LSIARDLRYHRIERPVAGADRDPDAHGASTARVLVMVMLARNDAEGRRTRVP